jgi:polyhydroxyalkanoate synthesis regulator phasin
MTPASELVKRLQTAGDLLTERGSSMSDEYNGLLMLEAASLIEAKDKRIEALERDISIITMKMCEYLERIEAKDEEIRRLKEALEKISGMIPKAPGYSHAVWEVARAALNQKE